MFTRNRYEEIATRLREIPADREALKVEEAELRQEILSALPGELSQIFPQWDGLTEVEGVVRSVDFNAWKMVLQTSESEVGLPELLNISVYNLPAESASRLGAVFARKRLPRVGSLIRISCDGAIAVKMGGGWQR